MRTECLRGECFGQAEVHTYVRTCGISVSIYVPSTKRHHRLSLEHPVQAYNVRFASHTSEGRERERNTLDYVAVPANRPSVAVPANRDAVHV